MVSQETDKAGSGFVIPSPCECEVPFGPARAEIIEKVCPESSVKGKPKKASVSREAEMQNGTPASPKQKTPNPATFFPKIHPYRVAVLFSFVITAKRNKTSNC